MKLKIGPAALITAAFIGPGTVTACTLAGANYGYALLWALGFSVIATIVLQEMSARLGIVGRMGLGEALRAEFTSKIGRIFSILLVISAIALGNAAYETGNILGGALGLEALTGKIIPMDAAGFHLNYWGLLIGFLAFTLLWFGNYKILEKSLIALVILMSVSFLITMFFLGPHLGELLKGLFVPTIPKGAILTVAGLIGTTVVPYNLFLHAALVQEKWTKVEELGEARKDIRISILFGGIISLSIVITSAIVLYGGEVPIKNAADMAMQLEPLLGSWAKILVGIGLFAAGITSAITAPMAAAYATSGILGWKRDLKSWKFKAVWLGVLLVGVLFSTLGFKPLSAILFAQAANGILLPVIAGFLLYVMNSKKILGSQTNSVWANILGVAIVLLSLGLGLKSLLSVFNFI